MSLSPLQDRLKTSFGVHSSHLKDLHAYSKVLLSLIVLMVFITWMPTLPELKGIKDYLPIHTTLESFSIVVSALIFAVGWSTYSQKIPTYITLLSLLFLGAAVLDFTHLLSFKGMPDLISPNGLEKAINFWLVARFLVAVGLLAFVVLTFRPLRLRVNRYIFLAAMILFLMAVHWIIFFHQDVLPPTFIEGQGLTLFKVYSEYLIIVVMLFTALLLWRRMQYQQSYDAAAFFTALCIMAMSEYFFTLYSDADDIYNLAGHIYKVIAYYYIYQAIFATMVQVPYVQLDESRKKVRQRNRLLNSILNNIPHVVYLKDVKNLRYKLFNRSGEKLFGVNQKQLLDKNDFEVFSQGQAAILSLKDEEALQSNHVVEIPQEMIQIAGETFILHTQKVAIKDEFGEPQYLLGISEDITAKVAAEEALRLSEQTLRASQSIAGIGSYVFDFQSGKWTASDTLKRIFGIDDSYESSAKNWLKIIHPDDRAMIKDYFHNETLNEGKSFNREYRITRYNDQSVRWVHGVGRLDTDIDGNPLKMIGTIQDITKRKKTSESLVKLSLAVEQSPDSIVITDLAGNIEYVNAKFSEVTGYTREEAIGQNPHILKSGKTPNAIYDDMWVSLRSGKTWQGELINRRKDQSLYIESATISPVKQQDGTITNYIAIKQDITEQKQLQDNIEYLAHFDQLTSLPNRVLLNDRVQYMISHAHRYGQSLAVMFLDLDHFKNINDTLGHSTGDKILVETAKRLKNSVRSEDTVSRLGGDEFVLIFPNTDEKSAMRIANKVIKDISAPNTIDHYELTITPSVGIAIYPFDGEDFETLLKNADTAMYHVKKGGRNSSHFFTQQMNESSVRNLELVSALHHALERNELEVYYQPQISIKTGRIIGAEALLRWNHPKMGFIPPSEFIPIAEESGLIIHIGEWVLRTAMVQIKKWRESGLPDLVIAVNLSAIQFRQLNFAEKLSKMIDEGGIPYESLELELTEAVAMHDPKYVIDVMNSLHEKGIRMAIDDFGTGYSSLSYLKQFRAHKLKIDQSFVSDINSSQRGSSIVNTIIDMAENFGMTTIAEGVETEEQLEFLCKHGCNEIQGYYFSKAITADEFTDYIHSAPSIQKDKFSKFKQYQ